MATQLSDSEIIRLSGLLETMLARSPNREVAFKAHGKAKDDNERNVIVLWTADLSAVLRLLGRVMCTERSGIYFSESGKRKALEAEARSEVANASEKPSCE